MKQLTARLLLSVLTAVLLIMALSPTGAIADPAADSSAPALKPMAPQIDPNADVGHRSESKKPLQATIEHNEKVGAPKKYPLKGNTAAGGGFMGKLRGGARTATEDPLRGRANNQPPLSSQATSGYGIIGVKFVLTVGKPPVINRVFAGTPAAKVGLVPEDVIVAVDGVPTIGLTKEEVYDLIIGSPGTTVNLSIMHRGGDFRVVTCMRMDINDISDPMVRKDYMLNM